MKHLNVLTALLYLMTITTLSAQVEQANNWHFGNELSVSFVGGVPVLRPSSAMKAFEGITSMSDANSQLLFYTNGGGRPFDPGQPVGFVQNTGIIWNRNHEVMYNMRGEEGGGFSARQSSIAMPDPAGENGIYYLFTMEEAEFNVGGTIIDQPQGRGLSYFVIDMNLNGGLGGVRLADQRVYTPAYEGLDATPMADGSGYWIICHSNNQNDAKFIVVPLTTAGVGTPTTYPISRVSGKIEFSPNGLLLLNDDKLYAFDNETGTIGSDPAELPGISSQSASFTPDSRYIFTLEERPVLGEVIVRYDLQNLSVPPLVIERLQTQVIQPVLVTAPFQIGPNGNIYFVEQTIIPGGSPRYGLSEIVCVSGENPSVNRYLIDLPYDTPAFLPQSLPQFVDAIFAVGLSPDTIRLDTLTVNACDNEVVTLMARENGTNYGWSTGETTDSILVASPEVYCVTITGDCFPTVDCQRLVFESSEVTVTFLRDEDRGCDGLFNIYDVAVEGDVNFLCVFVIDSTGTSPLELFSASLRPNDTIAVPSFPGVASVGLNFTVNTATCDNLSYSEPIPEFEDDRFRPELNVTADGEICNGKDIILEVTNRGSLEIDSVRYADGNTDNPRTLEAMFLTDVPVTVFSVCGDSTRLIFTGPVAEFCNCRGETPELITPNGNNTNDEFRLYANCPVEDYTLIIFNRWGQPVFKSTDAEQAWDGTKDGIPQNTDIYLYRMVFRFKDMETVEIREGKVSLVR
jgi:gliding motility-associated-like protein